MMEDDDVLQDLVLSLHHAYMITFDSSAAVKIIENHNGKRYPEKHTHCLQKRTV